MWVQLKHTATNPTRQLGPSLGDRSYVLGQCVKWNNFGPLWVVIHYSTTTSLLVGSRLCAIFTINGGKCNSKVHFSIKGSSYMLLFITKRKDFFVFSFLLRPRVPILWMAHDSSSPHSRISSRALSTSKAERKGFLGASAYIYDDFNVFLYSLSLLVFLLLTLRAQ